MCLACQPGITALAQWLDKAVENGNLQKTPKASFPTPGNSTAVFHGGSIITMAGGFFSAVDALVVKGDIIAYTGTLEEAKRVASSEARIVDLKGKCILPGFVEPHVHILFTAFADQYWISLTPLKIHSLEEALSAIKDGIANLKPSQTWASAYGYDPSRVKDHKEMTITDLNGVSMTIPIMVLNQSGHLAYINQKALDESGVPPSQVASDPNFQKDSKGVFTGVLIEAAIQAVAKAMPPAPPLDILDYCGKTLERWISVGCTAVFDAGIGLFGTSEVTITEKLHPTPLRLYGALSNNIIASLPTPIQQPPFSLGQSQIMAVKFWADGSTQGFTAWLTEPYPDTPYPGLPCGKAIYNSASELQEAMEPWLKEGFHLVVHSNGDAATDQVLSAYDGLFKGNPGRNKDLIHRIDHTTVVQQGQLKRAYELGLGVSHLIGHVYYWGATFRDYVLKDDRAKKIDPLGTDEKVGLIWSLHSDSPVTEVNPLLYLRTATTRLLYETDEVLGEDERVHLEAGLRGITVNPAKQLGIIDQVGSLEVGKKADMVVIDRDPRSVNLPKLKDLVVEQTWIGGTVVYSRP